MFLAIEEAKEELVPSENHLWLPPFSQFMGTTESAFEHVLNAISPPPPPSGQLHPASPRFVGDDKAEPSLSSGTWFLGPWWP